MSNLARDHSLPNQPIMVLPCGTVVIVVSSGVASEDGEVVSDGGGVSSTVDGLVSVGSGDTVGAVQALTRIMLTARSNSNFLIVAIIV